MLDGTKPPLKPESYSLSEFLATPGWWKSVVYSFNPDQNYTSEVSFLIIILSALVDKKQDLDVTEAMTLARIHEGHDRAEAAQYFLSKIFHSFRLIQSNYDRYLDSCVASQKRDALQLSEWLHLHWASMAVKFDWFGELLSMLNCNPSLIRVILKSTIGYVPLHLNSEEEVLKDLDSPTLTESIFPPVWWAKHVEYEYQPEANYNYELLLLSSMVDASYSGRILLEDIKAQIIAELPDNHQLLPAMEYVVEMVFAAAYDLEDLYLAYTEEFFHFESMVTPDVWLVKEKELLLIKFNWLGEVLQMLATNHRLAKRIELALLWGQSH